MQLLTFQVGVHLLAVPAPCVLSVGRVGSETDGASPSVATVDLAAILDPVGERAHARPVIRFNDGARVVELMVDRILALEHCADDDIQPWPMLLKALSMFTGATVIGGRTYQVIDVGTLKSRGKGRRR